MRMDDQSNLLAETTATTGGSDEAEQQRELPRKARKQRQATPILHFLSTQAFASPFDVNMAVDAGFKVVIPHTNAGLEHTTGLVQDAIFSRPVEAGCRTGLFIGGKDALLALDMLAAAQAALVPPFQLSTFADPGGSFTTAAAMVALVEDVYRDRTGRTLKGAEVAVFGATGVVGFASSIIAAQCGAKVTMASHIGVGALEPFVRAGRDRFGVDLEPVAAGRAADKGELVSRADIVLCAAAAGVRVLTGEVLTKARRLAVAADVNAVPPSGIEGVELFDRGRVLDGSDVSSVGPLAIGDVKYKTQAALFRSMLASRETVMLDFTHAFAKARKLVRGRPEKT
ncbi:methylene-tetrahydromethanopterin dehydrogenase N-terminal domain-containing protein [Hyphomicrobium sp.]|uniref:methylene-tetrahydromethanopterin dehydrogenase N-terminal domain-containing protein n=1 Tax=Hyphomicrobium sp. TaxID=82 RepID=UPI0025C71583|nr:methylene-tetrahydromethanopterin dehydrogenase N-terminal domain-containing protein [Hyphomicrobium sp.]